jgi:D-glycero-alpha-D-manno-heptose 1-phosphate guanylyltransferase
MSVSCVILAGGLGTRLRSVVPNLPKCLAPIAGRPFLEWQLTSLIERGVSHFVLALGHGAEFVIEFLDKSFFRELPIKIVVEKEILGTGGAAKFAMKSAGLVETLIINGDTFIGGPIDEMFTPLNKEIGESMRVATVRVADRGRFGGLSINRDNRVINFLEKGHVGPGLINAGLYRLSLDTLNDLSLQRFSLEDNLIPHLLSEGAIYARELEGPFIDIGIPDDYFFFQSFALSDEKKTKS